MRLCRIIEQYWTSWYLEAREIFWTGYFLVNSPFNFFRLKWKYFIWMSFLYLLHPTLSPLRHSNFGNLLKGVQFSAVCRVQFGKLGVKLVFCIGVTHPWLPPHPLTRPNTNRQEGFSCPSRPLLFPLCGNYIIKDTILSNISCLGK